MILINKNKKWCKPYIYTHKESTPNFDEKLSKKLYRIYDFSKNSTLP
nr:MAG TPA: hypothetical protein [Caudoviricetes sp.]